MNPSNIYKTSTHDDFIIKFKERIDAKSNSKDLSSIKCMIEGNINEGYYFQKTVFEEPIIMKGKLIGVSDALLIFKATDDFTRKGYILVEFKPDSQDISKMLRQIKIYREALSESPNVDFVDCVFVTYENNLTEEAKKILNFENIVYETIPTREPSFYNRAIISIQSRLNR